MPRSRSDRRRADNGLRFGEGNILPRNGRFQARWLDLDGRARAKTFATRDEAEDHLRDVYRQKRDNRYTAPSDLTIEGLVKNFLERGRSHFGTATYAAYRQRAERRIYPDLGSVKVIELTTPKVQFWIDRLVRAKWSPSTIQGTEMVLNAAFEEAVRLGIVLHNPVSGVRLPKSNAAVHTTWNAREMAIMLNHVRSKPMWNALYSLVLLTGMRPGEARALMWKDIDLELARLTVRRTITKGEDGRPTLGSTTKSHQTRTIALPASCVEALRSWRTQQKVERLRAAEWTEQGFVFTNRTGGYLSANAWTHNHKKFIRECGVPAITLHEMRHTNATVDMAAGTHPKIVSERLGHRRIETTLNLYSHVNPELQRTAIEALERRIFDSLPAQDAAQGSAE